MYEAYFGLKTKPFELVPNPQFLFQSQSHKKALNYLRYGLQERAGFILLTGEVGSGKTTIIRDIINNFDKDIVLSMVFNTCVNSKQIIAMINEDFGLNVFGKDKVDLLRDLNDYLVAVHAEAKHAVIIIDEAQNLTPSVLEDIRLLSNLEADSFKLVQIILVGQPELQSIIVRPELRQLRQRISVHCHLDPLTREETEAYVYHRLSMAGNRDALHWQEGTFDILYGYSGGWPRLINIFCDFVLLAAFVEETRELSVGMIDEVIGDVSWDRQVATAQLDHISDQDSESFETKVASIEIGQKFALLDVLHEEKSWIARRLTVHDGLLQRLSGRQQEESERFDAVQDRILQQLNILSASINKLSSIIYLPQPSSSKETIKSSNIKNSKSSPHGSSLPFSAPKKHWFRK